MNRKAKGSRRERQTKKIMESKGYTCVKAGGSLGIFDLICFNKKQIILIQVKSNFCSKKEKMIIGKFNNHPKNCHKQLWIYKDYKTIEIIKFSDIILNTKLCQKKNQ